MEPKRRPAATSSGEEEPGYEEDEEPAAAAGAAGKRDASALDAACNTLFGSVGQDISQSLYGGWQVLGPDSARLSEACPLESSP